MGKWIERVPDLRLDGSRPTSRALIARLQAFWLPGQPVLFIGSAPGTVGGRVAALRKTPLGDRRPYAGGQWLHTLLGLERMRVWWATTDAPEEYEDALLGAFAEGVPPELAATTPQPDLVMPWAVLRRPTGERRAHGITGAAAARASPWSDAGDHHHRAAARRGRWCRIGRPPPPHPEARRAARPVPRRAARARRGRPAPLRPRRPRPPAPAKAPTEVHLSREGLERLEAELHELRAVRRPEAIRRVATAREHGDLKENAEYHAAREELGFIVGRIHALEDRLRHVVVVDAADSETAVIGSTVVVEVDGETSVYLLVGSTDSDPAAGRISTASPVGRALLGHGPGAEVAVSTPSGAVDHLSDRRDPLTDGAAAPVTRAARSGARPVRRSGARPPRGRPASGSARPSLPRMLLT